VMWSGGMWRSTNEGEGRECKKDDCAGFETHQGDVILY
jgi:hypothetical protein